MKEVKLKRIALKNYMGAQDVIADFSGRTEISGKNCCGKTTLMHAYFDVLTGKLANGSAPNNICPIDSEGAEIPVKEIMRSIVLEVDGEDHEICKITKRKYRKDIFIGNETTYKLDGIPAKSAEVTEFINQIAPVDTVSMCSNASVFLGALKKSTTDARKAMEMLSGFCLDDFCNGNETYQKAYKMTKGKSVEDAIKGLKKTLRIENADLDRMNVELDYERRTLDGLDEERLRGLRAEKHALDERINALETTLGNLDSSANYYDFLMDEKEKIKDKLKELECEQKKDDMQEIEKLSKRAMELEKEIFEQSDKISSDSSETAKTETLIWLKESELERLTKEMDSEMQKSYADSDICPICGQELPKEQFIFRKEKFETEKESRLSELDRKIAFIKEEIAFLKVNTDEKNKKIAYTNDVLTQKKSEKERLEEKINSIYAKMQFLKTDEYVQLEKQLEEMERKAAEISDCRELKRKTMEEISSIKVMMAKKTAEIESISRETENHHEKIAELMDAVRTQAQAASDVERNISVLQEFSIAKNKAIEDLVNSKFEFINLKMSEETLDGTIKETLKIQVNGVDYFAGLNHGDRILAEIYLLKGLQDMNEIKLPIWVDDTESVDDWRIPDIERQEILIRRTDASKLSVKGMEE